MAQLGQSRQGDNKQAYMTSLDFPFPQFFGFFFFNAIKIDIFIDIMIILMLLTNLRATQSLKYY